MGKEIKMVKIYADVSMHTTVEIEIPEELAKRVLEAKEKKRRFDASDLLMEHDSFRDIVLDAYFDINSFEIVEDET